MDVRREEAAPELKDFQIGCSWVPVTPAKPSQTTEHLICTNLQENHSAKANCPESSLSYTPIVTQENLSGSGRLPENFLQEKQCQAAPACCNSPNLSNANGGSSSSFHGDDRWPSNISFTNLLAFAEGGKRAVVENALMNTEFVATSHISTHFRPQYESGQYTISFGSSSLQLKEKEGLIGVNVEAGLDIPNVSTDGRLIPSRPFFNLNLSPGTNKNSSESMISQFQPITPYPNNKEGYSEDPTRQTLSVDTLLGGKDAQNVTWVGVTELPENKEKSQLVIDQSCAATSTQLQENHKPDKGGTEEPDLIKTPQQKPRRKKHRPKVIIEGQNKSTPRSSAEKTTPPQETPRVKRKYVRKKGVNNPSEGNANETDVNKMTPTPTGNSVGKRKYVRKKGINKPDTDNPDNGTTDTGGLNQTSCRRSLNFNPEPQVRDESSLYCPSLYSNGVFQAENINAKEQSSNGQCGQGIEIMMEKSGIGISHKCVHSEDQEWQGSMEIPTLQCQCPSPSTNLYPLKENMPTDRILCTRAKCQIVFSDATHDKEANIVQMRMNTSEQTMPYSVTDSICSSTHVNTEKQEKGMGRLEIATAVVEESSRNATGAFYNSLQKYLPIFSQNVDNSDDALGLQVPEIYKKKRTEMGQYSEASSFQYGASTINNHMKFERQTSRDSYTNCFTSTSTTNITEKGKQVYEDFLALGPTGRAKKRKSKKVASLVEIYKELPAYPGQAATTSITKQGTETLHEPHAWFAAHATGTPSTVKAKKQSKKSKLNSTSQYSYQMPPTISSGAPLALPWNYMPPSIDSITEQLNQLNLNANNSQALVAYHTNYLEQHALVPFQGSGAVVPFNSLFDQVRRRRPRAKVDLDDETTRVWKLLLENINNEGINGTDEEKARWWEEERRVFRGRADSFIARMHLVQGDRRFSPWKGSVVDSVVGVFLTQNVSDHLSSSAFMSVAARFPVQEKTHPVELHEEGLGPNTEEADVCKTNPHGTLGSNKEIINMLAYGTDNKSLPDYEADSIRDLNNVKASDKKIDGFIPENNLSDQSANTSKPSPVISRETVTNKSGSLIEDRRDTEDSLSSQNSTSSPTPEITERSNSCLCSTSEQEPMTGDKPERLNSSTSFVKLLQMAGTVLHGVYESGNNENASEQNQQGQSESSAINLENDSYLNNATIPSKLVASSSKSTLSQEPNLGGRATKCDLSQKTSETSNWPSKSKICAGESSGLTSESAVHTKFHNAASACFPEATSQINQMSHVPAESSSQERIFKMQGFNPVCPENMPDVTGSSSNIDSSRSLEHREVNSDRYNMDYLKGNPIDGPKEKGTKTKKEKEKVDWDKLRKQVHASGREKTRTGNMDSVDWDAVRRADVSVIAQTIKERGMNNMLAERIKDFLNRLVRDHGSIDLEWLRDVPPDKAKEYLLSFRGLGLKSVECVRLLTLHHLAFPVDTNVGRIAVRLGWVPLQPLPESLQLHLLEMYPVLESIQKYLWPRLCKLDQRTLYELHYQMITFGKVFCTKSKPNCNACPMRGECRHFASAFASARLALPAPGETSIVSAHENTRADQRPMPSMNNLQLPPPQINQVNSISRVSNTQPIIEEPASPEPIVEVPATPEPTYAQASVCDIESAFDEDPDEIPTIQLNMEEFTNNLQKIIEQNNELQEGDTSKALVALTQEAASIPVPKLKNVSRLRTEHQVYELPDSHPLLEGLDKREPDDPSPYLLAIWTPGETMDSIEPPERRCSSEGFDKLCTDESCSSCNSIREANSQTVRGTLLIPCRTAMRGSFPLNGTYFQVNEVFSDHDSSLSPMAVPREWLWNLPRRTVYFGTSIPTIFKGLSTEGIQYCFWRGFVCVRGFDRKTRAPRPLIARLHFPASRLVKAKGKTDENNQ